MKPPLPQVIFKRVKKLSQFYLQVHRRDHCTSSCQVEPLYREVWQQHGQMCSAHKGQQLVCSLAWGEPGCAAQLLTSVSPVTPLKVSLAKQGATSSNPTLNCRCRKGNVQKSRKEPFLAADILPCHFPQAELWPGPCNGCMRHQRTQWPESDSNKLTLELIPLKPYLRDYYCYQGSWRKATVTPINFFLRDRSKKKKKIPQITQTGHKCNRVRCFIYTFLD